MSTESAEKILADILSRFTSSDKRMGEIQAMLTTIEVNLVGKLDPGGKPIIGMFERLRLVEEELATARRDKADKRDLVEHNDRIKELEASEKERSKFIYKIAGGTIAAAGAVCGVISWAIHYFGKP